MVQARAEAATRCPACGLGLPLYARFCASCGTPQPNPVGKPPARRPIYPVWVVVLFVGGAAIALLVAVLYATIALAPGLASTAGLDATQVRVSAIVASILGAALFAVQAVALVGLIRGRDWARTPATIACIGWALTCIGLPAAVLVLMALWRGRPPAA